MHWFVDGDQLCLALDDFVDLQESPAIFLPLESTDAKIIMTEGFGGLTILKLSHYFNTLKIQRLQELDPPIGSAARDLLTKLKADGGRP